MRIPVVNSLSTLIAIAIGAGAGAGIGADTGASSVTCASLCWY